MNYIPDDTRLFWAPDVGDTFSFELSSELALEYLKTHDSSLGHDFNIDAATGVLELIKMNQGPMLVTVLGIEGEWIIKTSDGVRVLLDRDNGYINLQHPAFVGGKTGMISIRNMQLHPYELPMSAYEIIKTPEQ